MDRIGSRAEAAETTDRPPTIGPVHRLTIDATYSAEMMPITAPIIMCQGS
jgi:hypothetical protein